MVVPPKSKFVVLSFLLKTQKRKIKKRVGCFGHTKCVSKQRLSLIPIYAFVGLKDLEIPVHFISGPWPMPRRKKCPRTNKKNPNYQDILPRTTLSSADQNHGRGKRHAARGSLLEHPKGSSERSEPVIRAW